MENIKFALFCDTDTKSVIETSYQEWEISQKIIKSYKEIPIGYGGMIIFPQT